MVRDEAVPTRLASSQLMNLELDELELDCHLRECDRVIELCKEARRFADDELRRVYTRSSQRAPWERLHLDGPQVSTVWKADDRLAELEETYDQIPASARCRKHKRKAPRQQLQRTRYLRNTRAARFQKCRAREAVARSRERKRDELIQPFEVLMPGVTVADGNLDERERDAFLMSCDSVIAMCTAARKMADNELEKVAASAAARQKLEDGLDALAFSDAEDRWELERLEVASQKETTTARDTLDRRETLWHEQRAEAYELTFRLTVSAQHRKCGGKDARTKKKYPQQVGDSGYISARQLKREQAHDANRRAKEAAQAAADVERQALWSARLAASQTTLLDVADRRTYRRWRRRCNPSAGPHHGRPDYHPLRSVPRKGVDGRGTPPPYRCTSVSVDDEDDDEDSDSEYEQINASALGIDEATARLLRELQYRDVCPEDYELLGCLDEHIEKPASMLCTAEQVRQFPLVIAGKISSQSDHIECGVCLCPLEHSDHGRQLPCCANALFHDDCITKWLTETKNTCPACLHEY